MINECKKIISIHKPPASIKLAPIKYALAVDAKEKWHVKRKPPARSNDPPSEAIIIYDQSSSSAVHDYLIDADYPIEAYL
jgi:hypothetical protein